MCTVTFLPLQSGGFVLTSNRDEKVKRPAALAPSLYTIGKHELIFPKDPVGQGSWLVINDKGRSVCILNGGTESHISTPPYKHSRGLVPIHFFDYQNALEFVSGYSFIGLEPFTLVIVDYDQLSEVRWNGHTVIHKILRMNQPHIWSSATLYTEGVIEARNEMFKNWFEQWRLNDDLASAIMDFHRFEGEKEDEQAIILSKNDFLRTVSISSVINNSHGIKMVYHDLIHASFSEISTAHSIKKYQSIMHE